MFWKKSEHQDKVDIEWIRLNSLEQLDSIKKESYDQLVLIYKHSTRCGISSMVLNRLERDWSKDLITIKTYYLDLIAFRNVSNAIAEVFKVYHESPQVLLIKDGEVIFDASHSSISAESLKKFE